MMASANVAANWVVGKRLLHWGIAIAVVIALVAPKPEEGEGLLHIAAGSTAAALVLTRLIWRLVGDVRPYFRDALRLKAPAFDKGARGLAPTLMQSGRLIGFLFLAAIPITASFAILGVGQGEEGPLLEAHEAAGTTIMVLAIGHAVALILFSLAIKYDLIGITLTGGARAFAEGGARGLVGLVVGAAVATSALAYVWGPYDIRAKAAAVSEAGEHGEHGGYRGDDD